MDAADRMYPGHPWTQGTHQHVSSSTHRCVLNTLSCQEKESYTCLSKFASSFSYLSKFRNTRGSNGHQHLFYPTCAQLAKEKLLYIFSGPVGYGWLSEQPNLCFRILAARTEVSALECRRLVSGSAAQLWANFDSSFLLVSTRIWITRRPRTETRVWLREICCPVCYCCCLIEEKVEEEEEEALKMIFFYVNDFQSWLCTVI